MILDISGKKIKLFENENNGKCFNFCFILLLRYLYFIIQSKFLGYLTRELNFDTDSNINFSKFNNNGK